MGKQATRRLERCSIDAYRVFNDSDHLVGFILALANGKWFNADTHDRQIDPILYTKPQMAFKNFPFDHSALFPSPTTHPKGQTDERAVRF